MILRNKSAAKPSAAEEPSAGIPAPEGGTAAAAEIPFEQLEAREKVRYFWRMTAMSDADFRKLVISSYNALHPGGAIRFIEDFDPYNDLSPELLKRIMEDYAKIVKRRDERCGRIVERNLKAFSDNEEESAALARERGDNVNADGHLNTIYNGLIELYTDKELVLSMMQQFIRSVLRNDFARQRENVAVDLSPGFNNRIWLLAEKNYFAEDDGR